MLSKEFILLLAHALGKNKNFKRKDALRNLSKVQGTYEKKWAREEKLKLDDEENDAKSVWEIEHKAINKIRPGNWKREEHALAKNLPEEVIVHDTSWCPMIEACNVLGLDQREVCSIFPGRNAEVVLKEMNPKLSLTIGKIRPKDDYCEYRYTLEPEYSTETKQ